MIGEIVTIVANVSLALSFVVALIFGIAQVKAAARDRRERLTLETLRTFQSREFAELIYYVVSGNMPSSQKGLNELALNERVMFIEFAQKMESLGMLVKAGLIDMDLVERTLGSLVTTAWLKYKTVFLTMREGDPYIGEYFQWLAERMEEMLKENPRIPAYL